MDNATRFLEAFSKIETQCRNISKEMKSSKFYFVLQEAAKRNKTIAKYQIELDEYADLRNAIIHQRTDQGEVIAQPVDRVVQQIESIAKKIYEPELVKDHFLKKVEICDATDGVAVAYEKMIRLKTSKLPVYKDHVFVGLMTMDKVAMWAMQNKESEIKLESLMKVQDQKEKVFIMSKNAEVNEVLLAFESIVNKGWTMLAVLITENGNANQTPLGIITVADIPKILAILD